MAAITKVYRLRTGQGGFTATTASSSDPYIVRVDEQVDHITVMELFVALSGAPVPKQTLKPFGGNYVVCDRYECDNKGRYLWQLTVHWKELEDSQPQDQSSPFPNSNSVDPNDWEPTVTRKPVTVFEPAQTMFYEGGYSGNADTKYAADASGGNRSPLTNSALTPFVDNLPPHQRQQSLWTIRWLRAQVPSDLTESELKLNDRILTFRHRGYSEAWLSKTAKIESVSLSQQKWGAQQLWEIVMEILVDPAGHFVTTMDVGTAEAFWAGESIPLSHLDGGGVGGGGGGGGYWPATEFTRVVVRDGTGRSVSEPITLDGAGKRAGETADAVYGKWRDFELTNFSDVPLLGDLIT